jgi:chemotaxis protein MotB
MALEEDPPAGVPEWVVTYGDMMSLLLTFFIMLVSLSELKSESGHLRAMLDAIREVFGAEMGEFGAPGPSLQKTSALDKLQSLGTRSQGGTKKSNRNSRGSGGPHRPVTSMAQGTVVTLGGPVFFSDFGATLTDELKQNLETIIQIVAEKPNRIELRGHASPEPLPPGTPYRDQLDLSFARAHAVALYLISRGIDPRRLLISAASDAEPRILSRDQANLALNHRVDVFLIDSYIASPEVRNLTAP